MSISRKHFQAFADMLAAERETVLRLARSLADCLGRFNDRFDRGRFMSAADCEEEEMSHGR